MKKAVLFAVLIPLIILAVFSVLYLLNVPMTEIAGEKIGFADLINFLLFQSPPNLQEASVKSDAEISAWAEQMNGTSLGSSAELLAKIGNPIRFCVYKDYNYCQTYSIAGGKIQETAEAAQKTVYVSFAVAGEIKSMAEKQNMQPLQALLVKSIKSGDIKGLSLGDVLNFGG